MRTGRLLAQHFDFTPLRVRSSTNIPTLGRNMLNSVFVTTGTIVITTICAVLGGYALVHLALPGRALVLGLLVASLFFPTRVTSLIAIFEIQRGLGLINTTAGPDPAVRDAQPRAERVHHARRLRADLARAGGRRAHRRRRRLAHTVQPCCCR